MAENSTQQVYFAPPVAPIKPYTGTFGRKQLLHLLRRTLFGVSNADLKAFEGKTLDQVVTALLNVTDFNPPPPLNDYSFTRGTIKQQQAYEKDKDGKFILDKDGNKILAFEKKADGITYQLDANGNKIPIISNILVQAYEKNADGTFKLDVAGNKILAYRKDSNGVYELDAAGNKNPIMETAMVQAFEKKPDGTFLLDVTGNKILAFAKNIDGTYKLDAKGNKIPIMENIMESPVSTVNTNDTEVKFSETWVNAKTNGAGGTDGSRRQSFKAWWAGLMIHQNRNLREKMTLFYANHFSMEADVVNAAIYTYRSNQLTRKYSLGNFKDLIRDITMDNGMLVYLNGNRNIKTAPDENYGRELQELFTMGKGFDPAVYSPEDIEKDVKAAARVLTGWTTNRQNLSIPAAFDPKLILHDTKDKTFSAFFGNKVIKGDATANGGQNEINAMLDMIFAHNEVAKFMVRKLYVYFVYHTITPDIETNVIVPLADLFRTSKYDIKPVLKALFTSDDFYKANNMGAMIKSPLDLMVGLVRQFDISIPTDPTLFEAQYMAWRTVAGFTSSLGQSIQDPPNVAGWAAYYQAPFYYDIWLDTATYPRRDRLQRDITNNGVATTGNEFNIVNPQARGISFKINYATWLKGFSNPTSSLDLISDLAELFYGVPISQTVKDNLRNGRLWTVKNLTNITKDKEWSDAVTAYLANPATTDPMAKSVPARMQSLVAYMMTAAELQLH